jgi:hypothetical protein
MTALFIKSSVVICFQIHFLVLREKGTSIKGPFDKRLVRQKRRKRDHTIINNSHNSLRRCWRVDVRDIVQ